jgi:hypothetical protein
MGGTLHVGLFENFLGCDSVLFAGDGEAVSRLAGTLRPLASGEVERLQLESLPFVQAHRGLSILAERSPRSSGLRYAAEEANGGQPRPAPCFTWRLSPDDWEDVVLRVEALSGTGPAHQYLDYLGVLDDVQVIAAFNEYDDEWWRRHG